MCCWCCFRWWFAVTRPLSYLSLSVGVKSAYSPATSTVYSQPPPPPQRQVTALKPLAPACSVSTSYNIYPVSTSVQQPPTPISSYTLESSFASTVSATTYSGDEERSWTAWATFSFIILCAWETLKGIAFILLGFAVKPFACCLQAFQVWPKSVNALPPPPPPPVLLLPCDLSLCSVPQASTTQVMIQLGTPPHPPPPITNRHSQISHSCSLRLSSRNSRSCSLSPSRSRSPLSKHHPSS